MTNVRFTGDADADWISVAFPYDPDVIKIVKGISSSLRSYEPSTKSWSVNQSVAEQLIDSLMAAGHSILHGKEPAPPKAVDIGAFFTPVTETDKAFIDAKADEIIAGIPEHLRHKVFRAVAKRLYPDMYAAR